MLRARRAFLEAGHFEILVEAIERGVLPRLPRGHTRYVVDAGTGVGFYIARLAEAARAAGFDELCWFGTDISKGAVRLAAAQERTVTFLVADTKRKLPLAAGGAALVMDIFAPRNLPEFRRLLEPNGLLLVVLPTQSHLAELVAQFALLHVQEDKRERVLADAQQWFEIENVERVRFPLDLSGAELMNLVLMTPSARHLEAGRIDRIRASQSVLTHAEFDLLFLRAG